MKPQVFDLASGIVTPDGERRREEILRIARASPELLRALERVREDLNWMLNNQQLLNANVFHYVDAAIAKAKGVNSDD